MDHDEAIKALDACSDRLVSLSLLLEADHFRHEDPNIGEMLESLGAQLPQTSNDAISVATKIVIAMGLPRGQAIDPATVEINAAVGRVVAACNRAGQTA